MGLRVRTRVREAITATGYVFIRPEGSSDIYFHPATEHHLELTASPRWSTRVSVITALSSFPLESGATAPAFQFHLGSQLALTQLPRWSGREVMTLVEALLLPYLRAATGPEAVADMLVAGDLAPSHGRGDVPLLRQGYHLARWWGLDGALARLREVAAKASDTDREVLTVAPWGTSEISEVLWGGRDLPEVPASPPAGIGDDGDARRHAWVRQAAADVEGSEEWERMPAHLLRPAGP